MKTLGAEDEFGICLNTTVLISGIDGMKQIPEMSINAISDAMSAASLAHAAVIAAGYNVRINVNSLDERSSGQNMLDELAELEKRADQIDQEIRKTMEERAKAETSLMKQC